LARLRDGVGSGRQSRLAGGDVFPSLLGFDPFEFAEKVAQGHVVAHGEDGGD